MKFPKIKRIICALCCCLLLAGLAPPAQAKGMTASIASGPVTFNGIKFDNSAALYPLLVYNDITYFPMTFFLCNFLGLSLKWEPSTQTFFIEKKGAGGQYASDGEGDSRRGTVSVSRVTYPVVVNGVPVDNRNAEWPLINYSNITYFPLTYNFAVNSFGWDYSWSASKGLVISSSGAVSLPPQPQTPLETAMSVLSEFYIQDHTYSGILSDLRAGTEKSFTAATTEKGLNSYQITLTAEPFVFVENGQSIDAAYPGKDLSSAPQFGCSSNASTRWEAEKVFSTISESELGYLAHSFLDCQFSGERINKIQSYSFTAQGDAVTWDLTVSFVSGRFSQYRAAVTLNADGTAVRAVKITTENYALLMTVTG